MKHTAMPLLLGLMACQPLPSEEEPNWFEGWNASPAGEVLPEGDAHRVTVELPVGKMTFDAVDELGEPVALVDGAALYDANGVALFFTDGHALYGFDRQDLLLVERTPWVDAAGTSIPVEGIHSIIWGEVSLLLTQEKTQIRIYDFSSQVLSPPIEMVVLDAVTGGIVSFTPRALVTTPGLQEGFGTPFLAADDDGNLLLGRERVFEGVNYILFTKALNGLVSCESGALLRPERLIAPALPEPTTFWPEHIYAVIRGEKWLLDNALCLSKAGSIVDDNNVGMAPLGGFDADFDGDGFDSIVWVHQ